MTKPKHKFRMDNPSLVIIQYNYINTFTDYWETGVNIGSYTRATHVFLIMYDEYDHFSNYFITMDSFVGPRVILSGEPVNNKVDLAKISYAPIQLKEIDFTIGRTK